MNKILANIEVVKPLSKEKFIDVMKSLWAWSSNAYEDIYNNVYVPNATAYHKEYAERAIKSSIERAKKYAEKTWKTEKRRMQYVNTVVEDIKKKLDDWKPSKYQPLTFADFDTNPGHNGLSGNCCLTKFTTEELGRCYDEICNNKYFKGATALSIGYLDSNSMCYYDGLCHFRPQVYMTLPDKLQKEWDEEQKHLTESIEEFYRNCNYCGD